LEECARRIGLGWEGRGRASFALRFGVGMTGGVMAYPRVRWDVLGSR
jgi:hypothetical protein